MSVSRIISCLFAGLVFLWSLWYLVTAFAWRSIVQVLLAAEFDPLFIFVMFASIFFYWSLRTWRWQLLLQRAGFAEASFFELYMVNSAALSFAQLTPFQSGEMVKLEIMKKLKGLDRYKGYGSFAVERVVDLLVVLLLALPAFFCWSSLPLNFKTIGIFLAATALFGGCLLLLVCRSSWFRFGRDLVLEIKPIVLDPVMLIKLLILTLGGWLTVAAGWYSALMMVGAAPDPVSVVLLTALATLINIFSLIPGAVGVSEVGIALILVFLGKAPACAQAGALSVRIYGLLILVAGVIQWYILRLYLKRKSRI